MWARNTKISDGFRAPERAAGHESPHVPQMKVIWTRKGYMRKRIFAVVLFILSIAPAAFAGCDKGFTERLNFTLDNAPTGFSAIAGPQRAGTQHALTPSAEAF